MHRQIETEFLFQALFDFGRQLALGGKRPAGRGAHQQKRGRNDDDERWNCNNETPNG